MKVVVISRVSDVDRRANISSLLEGCPYEWQFLDAYEASSIPEWFEALYDEKKSRRYRSYALMPGEKGCFSSHVGAWLKCAESGKPIVVLEDDCELRPDFFIKIKKIKDSAFDYVKLEKRSDGHKLDDNFMLNKKNRSGTVGYYLSPVGAVKFLAALKVIYMPIDHYIGMVWKHGVAPVGLIDKAITHNADFDTSIQYERKKGEAVGQKNKWLRALRKLRRYVDDFKYKKFLKNYMACSVRRR
ncbi:hypothetical protein GCM10022228_13780 [Halomonas cibimaris]|uniref:Glycosyl transferase family 25 domain-containing protein n=1 Tax=Halomonas cibimaris TaxID=657012 RepID=A0ABP7LMF6_9GAMM